MLSTTLTTILKMVEALPAERQKRVMDHLREYIRDMDDEERWDELFERTQDKLAYMTREATRQIAEGKSEPMDFNRL